MLDNIKYLMSLKTVDKNILEGNFELALNKLNFLIKSLFSSIFPKKNEIPKNIIMHNIEITELIFNPKVQLLFNILGIIAKNNPNTIEKTVV